VAFLIIREVYANILYGYDGLRALSAMIFRWTWMLLILLTIIAACGVLDGETNPLFAAMTVFDSRCDDGGICVDHSALRSCQDSVARMAYMYIRHRIWHVPALQPGSGCARPARAVC
jgi:hypothetical protein